MQNLLVTHYSKQQRETLVEILQVQLDDLAIPDLDLSESKQNINSLLKENTFTITTGQQLHLFLGPGYFINKIFTCIKLVQKYNESDSGNRAIPLFWMASEDHDIEEISGVELFGSIQTAKLEKGKITGEQDTRQILTLIQELETRLGDEANDAEFFQICKTAYLSQPTLSKATAYIIYKLFAEYGIVVIDANDAKLKQQMDSVFKTESIQQITTTIQKEVKSVFDAKKYHYQVMPRGTNLFEIDKSNRRSIANEGVYDAAKDYSPNALLRPLYQEQILPNITYVGGMAEVNYWLQLKPIFEYYHIPYPVIWLRDTIHLAKAKKVNQLLKHHLSIEEIARFDEVSFQSQYLAEELPKGLLEQMDESGQIIKGIKNDTDSEVWTNLHNQFEAINIALKKEFRGLKKELLAGKTYESSVETINKLYNTYFDKQKLQERSLSSLSLELNFNQNNCLKEEYLACPMQHGHYYLIEN